MPVPDHVIATHDLTKQFGSSIAVSDLDLRVRRGEIYGFLGRNGAGKTTTIRLMLGLLFPTSGTVELFGEPLRPGMTRDFERIGSLVEAPAAYANLTVRENLAVRARLIGLRGRDAVDAAIELAGIQDAANTRASRLSSGSLQRLGIAGALLHRPELLILDEPGTALDPAGIRELRELLKHLSKERGVTIFMSSHILAEVEQLATRIGVIHRGRLAEEIDIEDMRLRNRTYLELKVSDPGRAAWSLEECLGISDYEVGIGGMVRVYESLDRAAEINAELQTQGVAVSRLALAADRLEDRFLKLTSDEPEEDDRG
jgi:bacitracin transport system ATP-binding protein